MLCEDFNPYTYSFVAYLPQISAEQSNGSPGIRSADRSHTDHMTRDTMPACVAARETIW